METIDKHYVLVPSNELTKLEEARIKLWDFAERHNFNSIQMYELEQITSVMFNIANRNWEKHDN